ncbi:SDR family oxidoreductase [Streptomyces sp. NRRL F-5630]|uniref:SDR family oxidoreductase n=1 Tax=Streptomyces sp. NRRL F-5630 TaxID=1463864 RepID=UPI003EBD3509
MRCRPCRAHTCPKRPPLRSRVNAVGSGAAGTPSLNTLGPESGRDPKRSKGIFERFGSRREGVEAVAFLASEPPGYIAGQNLTVVGGYALGA